jgi:hypothetical protein
MSRNININFGSNTTPFNVYSGLTADTTVDLACSNVTTVCDFAVPDSILNSSVWVKIVCSDGSCQDQYYEVNIQPTPNCLPSPTPTNTPTITPTVTPSSPVLVPFTLYYTSVSSSIYSGWTDAGTACNSYTTGQTITVYALTNSSLSNGIILYKDTSYTVFSGATSDNYFVYVYNNKTYTFQVNNSGSISNYIICSSVPVTPTPTPSITPTIPVNNCYSGNITTYANCSNGGTATFTLNPGYTIDVVFQASMYEVLQPNQIVTGNLLDSLNNVIHTFSITLNSQGTYTDTIYTITTPGTYTLRANQINCSYLGGSTSTYATNCQAVPLPTPTPSFVPNYSISLNGGVCTPNIGNGIYTISGFMGGETIVVSTTYLVYLKPGAGGGKATLYVTSGANSSNTQSNCYTVNSYVELSTSLTINVPPSTTSVTVTVNAVVINIITPYDNGTVNVYLTSVNGKTISGVGINGCTGNSSGTC